MPSRRRPRARLRPAAGLDPARRRPRADRHLARRRRPRHAHRRGDRRRPRPDLAHRDRERRRLALRSAADRQPAGTAGIAVRWLRAGVRDGLSRPRSPSTWPARRRDRLPAPRRARASARRRAEGARARPPPAHLLALRIPRASNAVVTAFAALEPKSDCGEPRPCSSRARSSSSPGSRTARSG